MLRGAAVTKEIGHSGNDEPHVPGLFFIAALARHCALLDTEAADSAALCVERLFIKRHAQLEPADKQRWKTLNIGAEIPCVPLFAKLAAQVQKAPGHLRGSTCWHHAEELTWQIQIAGKLLSGAWKGKPLFKREFVAWARLQ